MASVETAGQTTIHGSELTFVGTAAPHGVTNAFDVELTNAVLGTIRGIEYFDRARQKLYVLVPIVFTGRDVLFFIGAKL